MRRFAGLFCAAFIALSPVGASAADIDWKYWGKFVAQHGCELAVHRAARGVEELELAAQLGAQFSCKWVVEQLIAKYEGTTPPDSPAAHYVDVARHILDRDACFSDESCGLGGSCTLRRCMLVTPTLPQSVHCHSDLDCGAGGLCLAKRCTIVGTKIPTFHICSSDSQCGDDEKCGAGRCIKSAAKTWAKYCHPERGICVLNANP
jgi:hypothetical protein